MSPHATMLLLLLPLRRFWSDAARRRDYSGNWAAAAGDVKRMQWWRGALWLAAAAAHCWVMPVSDTESPVTSLQRYLAHPAGCPPPTTLHRLLPVRRASLYSTPRLSFMLTDVCLTTHCNEIGTAVQKPLSCHGTYVSRHRCVLDVVRQTNVGCRSRHYNAIH